MKTLPFVSIIVPVYNNAKLIFKCVESLLNQTYPKDKMEIIIVDNGSKDNTVKVIEQYPIKLFIEDKIQSSYAARNKGIDNAKGEVIAFTDSDAIADENWLQCGIEDMERLNVDYLGSRVEMFSSQDKLSHCDMFEMYFAFPIDRHIEQFHFASTCNLFVRKEVFDSVGNFDSRFTSGGDVEFGTRVWLKGLKQGYSDKAIIHHPTRSTLKALIKRSIRYGKGQATLSKLYPERFGKLYKVIFKLLFSHPPKPKIVRKRQSKIKLNFYQKIIVYIIQYIDWLFIYLTMVFSLFK